MMNDGMTRGHAHMNGSRPVRTLALRAIDSKKQKHEQRMQKIYPGHRLEERERRELVRIDGSLMMSD